MLFTIKKKNPRNGPYVDLVVSHMHPGCMQEVVTGTLWRPLHSPAVQIIYQTMHDTSLLKTLQGLLTPLRIKPKLLTVHTRLTPPGPGHPCQPRLPHSPLQPPLPPAVPQTSQAWRCLRALAHAVPSTWTRFSWPLPPAACHSLVNANNFKITFLPWHRTTKAEFLREAYSLNLGSAFEPF